MTASDTFVASATHHQGPAVGADSRESDRAAFRAGDVEWRPGARAALQLVRDAGLPTALVTNSLRRITELALDGIGHRRVTILVRRWRASRCASRRMPARGGWARRSRARSASCACSRR